MVAWVHLRLYGRSMTGSGGGGGISAVNACSSGENSLIMGYLSGLMVATVM